MSGNYNHEESAVFPYRFADETPGYPVQQYVTLNPITIYIDHPKQGFEFFWAYYVTGFDYRVHCQFCFKGSLSRRLNTRIGQSGKPYTVSERVL